jgi:serine/threonine protein kinase
MVRKKIEKKATSTSSQSLSRKFQIDKKESFSLIGYGRTILYIKDKMIDKTISHYKILGKLGEGGMGIVHKAQDTELDRIVALKFLLRHLLCDKEAKNRVVHEAKAASALIIHITTVCKIIEHGMIRFIMKDLGVRPWRIEL